MAVVISRAHLAEIHRQAEVAWPGEAVGILAGVSATRRVARVVPLTNERGGAAFRVGGLELMAAESSLADAGHEVLGYYHSHPEQPARPSTRDHEHAWPHVTWLIVSVCGGRAVDTRAWRLQPDRSASVPEPISIIEEDRPMATIHIPSPLRTYTEGKASVELDGATVGEVLGALTRTFSGLEKHLRDGEGKLRTFVNVYVGDEDVRYLQQDETPVGPGTEITIVPSIAGGVQ